IRDVLAFRTRARRVYVCNLRPQLPETAGFTCEDHVRAVLEHGIRPDVVVASTGPEAPGTGGSLLGIPVVEGELARPDGTGHDPDRLAALLEMLT
ncbi:MAG TPA: hypothetical protein VLX59_19920, partial [Acidimicrobiales bacterium]|nr:hypothetical protein [Acidimicrobiales bacterium]